MNVQWIYNSVLFFSAGALMGLAYRQRCAIDNMQRDLNYLRRSHYYHLHIESTYWKPKIHRELPPDADTGAYGDAVDEAGAHWFPEGWEKDYK